MNAFAEAHGLPAGHEAKIIDLGNRMTGQRRGDGRIAVIGANGKPAGFTISEREAAAMR